MLWKCRLGGLRCGGPAITSAPGALELVLPFVALLVKNPTGSPAAVVPSHARWFRASDLREHLSAGGGLSVSVGRSPAGCQVQPLKDLVSVALFGCIQLFVVPESASRLKSKGFPSHLRGCINLRRHSDGQPSGHPSLGRVSLLVAGQRCEVGVGHTAGSPRGFEVASSTVPWRPGASDLPTEPVRAAGMSSRWRVGRQRP